MQETLCALLIAATTVAAQSSSSSNWVGVWQGELDGIPSVILTLATDRGTLQGTLVLNGINNEGGKPHIAVRETHILLHTTQSGKSLSFEVERLRGGSNTMNFTVEETSSVSAKIHCLNCGDDAPVVEITKQD
jgi:hypothetical protein